MGRKLLDLTGKKFGMLTVVGYFGPDPKGMGARWKCRCDCGKEIDALGHSLKIGNKKSCGCSTTSMLIAAMSKYPPSDGITKICRRCGKRKPVKVFSRSKTSSDGFHCYCQTCNNAYQMESNKRRRAKGFPGYKTEAARRLRREVLTHYSGGEPKCACCGETIFEFLALDHINGGGNQHRIRLGSNVAVYREVRRLGYPSGYRVLCHNCNSAIGHHGFCPHQRQAKAA